MISRPKIVLDTDTYNEVDDQFALAHLILSPEAVDLQAIYAAPFDNRRSKGPEDGMEKSYEEIGRVLESIRPSQCPPVYKGSRRFMEKAGGVVESDVVTDLIDRALRIENEKLVVLAIGACTNVASALNAEPRIAEKITIVWLGGHAPYWPNTKEFNLRQDLHSARTLLDTEVSLVLLPCEPVTSHLVVTVPELEKHLAPYSKLGAYLTKVVTEYGDNSPGWSKVIWDIAASAWAINPKWVDTQNARSPVLRDDVTWERPTPQDRREIQIARRLKRDAIFADFYAKAKKLGK